MARKRVMQETPYTIALDVGYGYTQAADTLGNTDMQLSAYCYAPARLSGDELRSAQAAYAALTLYDGDDTLLLGDMAAAYAGSHDMLVRLTGRENSDDGHAVRAMLTRMAAARLLSSSVHDGDIVHAEIVTGLPVDYLRDRDALRNALTGQHKIVTDASDFILNVTAVRVMPQPLGTLYSYMLTDDGNPAQFPYDVITVFDFGTLTVQSVTFGAGGGAGSPGRGYLGALSFSVDAGAHVIQDALYEWLDAEYGSRDYPLEKINAAIKTGSLRVMGEARDVSNVIERATRQILAIMQRRANATVGSALDSDMILVAGGIAPLMYPRIAEVYGSGRVFLADNPQWSNVTGYRRYALFKQLAD